MTGSPWVEWKMGATMGQTVKTRAPLTGAERRYLEMGRGQPGGKLPLFDRQGQEISGSLIRSCVDKGLAEPWFANPLKPDWLVCRLTEQGRASL